MVELSPQAQIRLQQMRDNYKQSLPNKKAELEASWAACMQASWQGECVAELKGLAHKLGGSAGLYGFDELGKAARALDLGLSMDADALDKVCVAPILALMVQLESQFSIALS